MLGGGSDSGTAFWLRQQVRTVQRRLGLAVLCGLAGGVLIVTQARLLAELCQRVVMDKAGLATLGHLLAAVAVTAALRGVAVYGSEHAAVQAAAEVRQQVRTRLYRRLLQVKPTGQAGESGALTEAVTAGVEGLEAYIARFLPQMLLAGMLPLGMLLAVLPSEWRSGLVLLFSAPFIPLLMVLIGKGSEALNRRQWELLARLSGHLLDLVQGLPDLKIFGRAKQEAEQVAAVSERYRQGTMAVLRVAFLSAFTLEFFATVGTAVVAVLIGFRLLAGAMTLADGLFVLLLAPEFYLPLRNLGLAYHSRMNGLAAAERIMPLLHEGSLPQEITGLHEETTGQQHRKPSACSRIAPEIVCQSLSFRYGGARGGVREISLTIPSGSLTGLVGASGSGKSTLARLLLGLAQPEQGRIMVDGNDLSGLDQAAWRSQLAWVAQQPFFMTASIQENLLLGVPQVDQADIARVLGAVGLEQVIARLPQGLATQLGERGAGLSGGELRRLALARVLLRDARLVVLDEPTAGLDADNERLVLDALGVLAEGRTVLVISHREAVIARCDRLIELVDGRLERVTTPRQYLGGAS